MTRVLVVIGTRPEAIKLAPVIRSLRRQGNDFACRVCVTGQHRELLDQALAVFGIAPDIDLDVMQPGQSLESLMSALMARLPAVMESVRPDIVVVQGDTTSAFAAALAAFYRKIPVGHVEAGLRTHDLSRPFPEEANRRLISALARWHFAPTETARANLLREGIDPAWICVTGNTIVDALEEIAALSGATASRFGTETSRRIVLITAHRRESFGPGLASIARAIARLAERFPEVSFVYPIHPNPNVASAVEAHLRGLPNVILTHPLNYVEFVGLMKRSELILTDSGGVQEEAPSLGKPVLVLRATTERPEAVAAGWAELVGTNEDRIVEAAERRLVSQPGAFGEGRVNPFGDGRAAQRIVEFLIETMARARFPTGTDAGDALMPRRVLFRELKGGRVPGLAGIILCGGQSRRMGRPKAQLEIGGRSLILHMMEIFAAAVETIVVVAAAEQDLGDLHAGVPFQIVRDEQTFLGPLYGIARGLESLPPGFDAAFVAGVDMPLLSPAFVREMASRLGPSDIAVPIAEGKVQSLAGVYRRNVASTARRLIEQGRMRPLFLLEEHPAARIGADELKVVDPNLDSLRNANTPEEFTELCLLWTLRQDDQAGSRTNP